MSDHREEVKMDPVYLRDEVEVSSSCIGGTDLRVSLQRDAIADDPSDVGHALRIRAKRWGRPALVDAKQDVVLDLEARDFERLAELLATAIARARAAGLLPAPELPS